MSEYSTEDWREAIYIDFEGRVKDPPTFLGMCCRDSWDVDILEPLLWSAEDYGHPKGEVFSLTPLVAYEGRSPQADGLTHDAHGRIRW